MASDDDFLSELTECESDESSVGKGKKPATRPGWRVRKALQPARATTYSAQSLYDQIHGGDINLEPEYQRDVVWPESKQMMIIDSIFRNFYIPPVIFAVKNHDDGAESKTCIDGKQRLTSIHRFMDGLIPHKDPLTSEKWWFKDVLNSRGPKRKVLPEKYRKVFVNKQIVCVEFHEITEDDEREVFQRVQLGMALTPAEKLQVNSTSRAVFVREILNTFLREDGVLSADNLNWNTSRATDFRCLGHAIHIMETSYKKPGVSDFIQLEKWLKNPKSLEKSFKTDVMETYKIFSAIAKDTKHSKVLKKYKKVAPVEFVYVPVFIYMHKDSSSLSQLAGGIEAMLDHVRTAHRDVRMNNRVQKDFTEFISNWKNGPTAKGEVQETGAGQKRKRTAASTRKKKKNADDDDGMDVGSEDSDYDGKAFKQKKPSSQKAPIQKVASSTSNPASNAKPLSPTVKTEFDGINKALQSAAISTSNPPQTIDRLAALRKASQYQAARAAQPSGPRNSLPTWAGGPNDNDRSGMRAAANPQMLPSPAQGYVVPAAAAVSAPPSTIYSYNGGLPPPPATGSSTSSVEVPVWKTQPRPTIASPTAPRATLPPRPSGSASYHGERENNSSWRGYDERDQDRRYDSHHKRNSGSFGGGGNHRQPDDRDKVRGQSGVWR